jgi:hypothetical protein
LQETLKSICEKIVIPNLMFRDEDEELFEDNPLEYLRRDVEGSDTGARAPTRPSPTAPALSGAPWPCALCATPHDGRPRRRHAPPIGLRARQGAADALRRGGHAGGEQMIIASDRHAAAKARLGPTRVV